MTHYGDQHGRLCRFHCVSVQFLRGCLQEGVSNVPLSIQSLFISSQAPKPVTDLPHAIELSSCLSSYKHAQVPTYKSGTAAFQEVPVTEIYRPITKGAFAITSAAQV